MQRLNPYPCARPCPAEIAEECRYFLREIEGLILRVIVKTDKLLSLKQNSAYENEDQKCKIRLYWRILHFGAEEEAWSHIKFCN